MTARAGNWDLVGYDSDPVPGTPGEVGDEGEHYTGVADTIADQIARLKKLADPDERLKGAYAEKLIESCEDLADHLGKVEDRFRTTGGLLSGFESDLTTGRVATGMALHDAEAAVKGKDLAELWPVRGMPPTDPALKAAYDKAHGAKGHFDDRAESVASDIRKASDDDMKDSRWDKFKDAVHSIAGVLDGIADILGYIAAALVIISLFIPGLNLLTLALILTVGALALHTLLAATGNGSWVDVAFDVLGLLTLGGGTALLQGAKMSAKVALRTAGKAAGKQAAKSALFRGSFNGGKGLLGKMSVVKNYLFNGSLAKTMKGEYLNAFRNVIAKGSVPPLKLGMPGKVELGALWKAGGDSDLARIYLQLGKMSENGISSGFAGIKALGASTLNWTGNIAQIGGKIVDPDINTDLGGGFDPYDVPAYDDFSNHFTWTPGEL